MSENHDSGDFSFGLAFGCLLGFSGACLLGALVKSQFVASGFIGAYQTLIGTVIALGGAWAAVFAVQKQTQQSKSEFEILNQKKKSAAQAVLPLMLFRVTGYLKQIIEELWTLQNFLLYPNYGDPRERVILKEFFEHRHKIDLSDKIIESLVATIEFGEADLAAYLTTYCQRLKNLSELFVEVREFSNDSLMGLEMYQVELAFTNAFDVYTRTEILNSSIKNIRLHKIPEPELINFISAFESFGFGFLDNPNLLKSFESFLELGKVDSTKS
jgi:hypothetical protein